MPTKPPKPDKLANPEYAKAMSEIRASGKSGKHQDGRTRRARTRSAQLSRELRTQDA